VWNTTLLIGWDEPGGTYDHVPPGPAAPPDPAAPAGEQGFEFDRSGYRVPAILVSPWVESGSVYNEEYRHTSLIATLRKKWGLEITPELIIKVFRDLAWHLFPRLAPEGEVH
jgi:phospholipase C